jgi:hypothetical protein
MLQVTLRSTSYVLASENTQKVYKIFYWLRKDWTKGTGSLPPVKGLV